MNYKDVTLTPIEKKVLKLFPKYKLDPTFENLEGYLKFPSYDDLYSAIKNLKELKFIHEYMISESTHYSITDKGKRYHEYRKGIRRKIFVSIGTGIVISVISGIVLSLINKG